MDRLERESVIHPKQWLSRLEAIGMSEEPDRVAALKVLLNYRFGLPKATLEVEHGLTKSTEDLLREIATSERHRETLELLERRRLRAASVEVEVLKEEPCLRSSTAPD